MIVTHTDLYRAHLGCVNFDSRFLAPVALRRSSSTCTMLTRSSNALESKRCSTKFTQDKRGALTATGVEMNSVESPRLEHTSRTSDVHNLLKQEERGVLPESRFGTRKSTFRKNTGR